MPKRQVLIPLAVYDRVQSRLETSPHEFDVLRWSSSEITWPDGSLVAASDYKPEVGWIPIDLMFAGDFVSFVDSLLEP